MHAASLPTPTPRTRPMGPTRIRHHAAGGFHEVHFVFASFDGRAVVPELEGAPIDITFDGPLRGVGVNTANELGPVLRRWIAEAG